ncbi:hypothetical protein Vretifemale_16077, partial [Volvox reticuliferus]
MQIELPRCKLPYAFPGRKISSAKGHCVSTDDELLGFDVPRRRRTTCTTRPREISAVDLWFLPSSKPDDEDEEALIAEALLKIANAASGGTSDRPRGAATVTGPKRNGYSSSYGGGTNGRTNAAGVGTAASWPHNGVDIYGGNGPAKRRRSQELLAGEDDLMATDEADTVHLYDEDMAMHNSPPRGLLAVHEEVAPRHPHHEIPRRGRPTHPSSSGPSGRLTGCTVGSLSAQALANGLSHLVQVDARAPTGTAAAAPRGAAHGPSGRMGSGSAAAATATASSHVNEPIEDSRKPPPPVFLIDGSVPGGIRPLNGARGSAALFGHSSLPGAAPPPPPRVGHRAPPSSEAMQQSASVSTAGGGGGGKPSAQRTTAAAGGAVRSGDPLGQAPGFGVAAAGGDVVVKPEAATGASGTRGSVGSGPVGPAREGASRGATDREKLPTAKLTTGPMGLDRQGSQHDRTSERAAATAAASSGGGSGRAWAGGGGGSGSGAAMDVKMEPESNSAPGSPSGGGGSGLESGGNGANGGGGGGAAAAVNGRQAGDSAATSCRTAQMTGSAAEATASGKTPVLVMPPSATGNPLAELLAAAGGPMGPWSQLAGLLPGATSHWALPSAAAAAVATDLMVKGLAEAAGKGGGGAMSRFQPLSGPPGAVMTQLQLQHQHQTAMMLKAAAVAAGAGGPPGLPGTLAALPPNCLDYLRALQAGGPAAAAAALGAHPLSLQAAAAAAAACNAAPSAAAGTPGAPSGLPLFGSAAGGVNGGAAAAGGSGVPSPPHGPSRVARGVPFRRCAQHVYIAHFIAQQQKGQQQQQQQRLHQQGVSGAAGASSTRHQQQQQRPQISDPSRAGTGSPGEVRDSPSPAEHSGGFCGDLSGGGGGGGGGGCNGARSPNGRCNGNNGTCSNGNGCGGGRSQHPSPAGDTSARSPRVNGIGIAAAKTDVKTDADGAATSAAATLPGTVASVRNGLHGLTQ